MKSNCVGRVRDLDIGEMIPVTSAPVASKDLMIGVHQRTIDETVKEYATFVDAHFWTVRNSLGHVLMGFSLEGETFLSICCRLLMSLSI